MSRHSGFIAAAALAFVLAACRQGAQQAERVALDEIARKTEQEAARKAQREAVHKLERQAAAEAERLGVGKAAGRLPRPDRPLVVTNRQPQAAEEEKSKALSRGLDVVIGMAKADAAANRSAEER
jgi:hypothetical protein